MFIRVEIAVIPYKLISRSLRSTHFFLVCFVLFLSFPASPSRKVAFGSFLAIFYISLCVLICICEL